MKSNLKSILLGAALLASAPFASAQITLHNFSAFLSPDTFFLGNWELTGDPGGTNSPRASFAQVAGAYNFTGGTNADDASALYFFSAPLDISGLTLLQISARLLPGNTAPSFTITLADSSFNTAFAFFSTAAFARPDFTTVSVPLTSFGFNAHDLASFQISGNIGGGTQLLNLSVDNLAVAAPRLTAVPEPATYDALAALVLLGVIARRRTV